MSPAERLQALGYEGTDLKVMPDGGVAFIHKLLYTSALLVMSKQSFDDPFGSSDDRWCYQTYADAKAALDRWDPEVDPEPDGWHRHPSTGRRRPGGDGASEYFNL